MSTKIYLSRTLNIVVLTLNSMMSVFAFD